MEDSIQTLSALLSVSRATSFVGCRGRLKLCLKTPCVIFLHLALYSLVCIKYFPFLVHWSSLYLAVAEFWVHSVSQATSFARCRPLHILRSRGRQHPNSFRVVSVSLALLHLLAVVLWAHILRTRGRQHLNSFSAVSPVRFCVLCLFSCVLVRKNVLLFLFFYFFCRFMFMFRMRDFVLCLLFTRDASEKRTSRKGLKG